MRDTWRSDLQALSALAGSSLSGLLRVVCTVRAVFDLKAADSLVHRLEDEVLVLGEQLTVDLLGRLDFAVSHLAADLRVRGARGDHGGRHRAVLLGAFRDPIAQQNRKRGSNKTKTWRYLTLEEPHPPPRARADALGQERKPFAISIPEAIDG